MNKSILLPLTLSASLVGCGSGAIAPSSHPSINSSSYATSSVSSRGTYFGDASPTTEQWLKLPDGRRLHLVPVSAATRARVHQALAPVAQGFADGIYAFLPKGTKVYSVDTLVVRSGNAVQSFGPDTQSSIVNGALTVKKSDGSEAVFPSNARAQLGSGKYFVFPGRTLPAWTTRSHARLVKIVS